MAPKLNETEGTKMSRPKIETSANKPPAKQMSKKRQKRIKAEAQSVKPIKRKKLSLEQRAREDLEKSEYLNEMGLSLLDLEETSNDIYSDNNVDTNSDTNFDLNSDIINCGTNSDINSDLNSKDKFTKLQPTLYEPVLILPPECEGLRHNSDNSSPSTNDKGNFPHLVDEIMLNIFKRLRKSTLLNCAQVCKHWNRIVFDETLWRRIDLGDRTVKSGVMDTVISRGVQVLRLAKSQVDSPLFTHFFGSSQLQYLDLSMTVISLDSLQQLLASCRQLKKLSLENVSVNDEICSCIGTNRNLVTVNLSMCKGLTEKGLCYILKGCTSIEELNLAWTHLDHSTLISMGNKLPICLKRLNVSGFRDTLTDDVVITIIHRCREIEELDISDSALLTRAVLEKFSELQKLKYLAVSRCYNLKQNFVLRNVPNLKSLVMFGSFAEATSQQLKLSLPYVLVNESLFSTIARPTTGIRCTSLWGLRVRN